MLYIKDILHRGITHGNYIYRSFIFFILSNITGFLMFLKDRDLLKTIIGIMIGTQMTSLSANLMNQFIKPLAQFMTVLIIKLFTFNTASVSFVEINFSLIDIVTTIGTVLLTVYAIYLIWKFSTTEASVIYTYTNNLITTYTEYYAKHPA